jgi:hypothetical protein
VSVRCALLFESRGGELIKLERASSDHSRQRKAKESRRERKIPRGFVIKSWAVSVECLGSWSQRVCADASESSLSAEDFHQPKSLSFSPSNQARFLLAVRIKLRCESQAANLIPRHRSVRFGEWRSARWRLCVPVCQPLTLFLSSSEGYLRQTVCCGCTINTRIFAHHVDHFLRSSWRMWVLFHGCAAMYCSFCANWERGSHKRITFMYATKRTHFWATIDLK